MALSKYSLIENQLENDSCIYPPALLIDEKERKQHPLSPIEENLMNLTTTKILTAINSDNFIDSIKTVDLKLYNFTKKSNFWFDVIPKNWGTTNKLEFIMRNDIHVIATTLICPKQTPGHTDIIKRICANNYITWYLCVECLVLHEDDFLSVISDTGNGSLHREKKHAFLTCVSEGRDIMMRAKLADQYKINNVKFDKMVNRKIKDLESHPKLLIAKKVGKQKVIKRIIFTFPPSKARFLHLNSEIIDIVADNNVVDIVADNNVDIVAGNNVVDIVAGNNGYGDGDDDQHHRQSVFKSQIVDEPPLEAPAVQVNGYIAFSAPVQTARIDTPKWNPYAFANLPHGIPLYQPSPINNSFPLTQYRASSLGGGT